MVLGDKPLAVRVDKDLRKKLEDEAKRKHISVSAVARQILAAHYEKESERHGNNA